MEKYLFKYFTKGFDCSKVGLQRKRASGESSTCTKGVNEIQDYLECRCIAPNDAAWRLLQFEIHHTNPSVERLPVHLPLGNSVVYNEDDSLEQVLQNPWNQITKLTAWFEANKTYPEAVCYTYAEFPEHFTWHADGKYWDYRRGTVKVARSYSEIRTIEGQQYPTFQAACQAPGLLGDDHPLALFEEHFSRMGEDYMHRIGHSMTYHSTPFTQHVRSFVLAEIDKLLRNSGYSLPHFNLPEPILTSACAVGNRLLTDEQAYDIDRISVEAAEQLNQLNLNQKHVYDVVLQSVNNCIGHTFFVHGYGGTGKTFLWNALLNAVRAQGKIALAVASSSIAALLLPGYLLLPPESRNISSLVSFVYNESSISDMVAYFCERAILAPTNDIAAEINSHMISQLPTEQMSYYSSDIIDDSTANRATLEAFYPVEFLNTI
ncbi:uncharacterized protein [Oryza sativa Japonica Group]|uniref:uncharacterized protein n=1 Tax=Oryza sativa subsp. japonica TaxID=39947 RepID=UPI000775354C|nr:uncharacterized protein LOC107280629 [Oryza sativa Japonica Group]